MIYAPPHVHRAQNFSYRELLNQCKLSEIIERISVTVCDFFLHICNYISVVLNQLAEGIANYITYLLFDEEVTVIRRTRIERLSPQFLPDGYDFFPLMAAPLRQVNPIPSAPSHAREFQQCPTPLKELLIPYQSLPSQSPQFENNCFDNAKKNLLSDAEIDELKNLTNFTLFSLLLVRSLVFHSNTIHCCAQSIQNEFIAPRYFYFKRANSPISSLWQRLVAVRESFWKLSNEEKLAIVTHIDTEITHLPLQNLYQLRVKKVSELPVPLECDTPELKQAKSAAIDNAKKMEDRRSHPNDAILSNAAIKVYKEISAFANTLLKGNNEFSNALSAVNWS